MCKVRNDEHVKNDNFSFRMRHLLFFLIIVVTVSRAQVPKPPWASGGTSAAKPASSKLEEQ